MPKRPREPNQLAKVVVDIATGELPDSVFQEKRPSPRRGHAGGVKGGSARAAKLTDEQKERLLSEQPKHVGAAQSQKRTTKALIEHCRELLFAYCSFDNGIHKNKRYNHRIMESVSVSSWLADAF
jgi:hypothetical protein